MGTNMGEPSPVPRRQTVRLDRLKPPARHRKQPDLPEQQVFDAVRARNERRTWREKYTKKYKGKHYQDKGRK